MMAQKSAKPASKQRLSILPKVKGFLNALSERYQRILQIVDEALASDNMKDRTWAVELIMKRLPLPEKSSDTSEKAAPKAEPLNVENLSHEMLLSRIRESLQPLNTMNVSAEKGALANEPSGEES